MKVKLKSIQYLLAAALLVSSCGNKEEQPDEVSSVSQVQISPGCYRMVIQNDTAVLELEITDSIVSGKLVYNRYEKDDNTGLISGFISNGKIDAWYIYQSEGVESVRQVVYKIGNNELFEGYGEITGTKDSAAFRFPQALRYEENHPYQKIPCNEARL